MKITSKMRKNIFRRQLAMAQFLAGKLSYKEYQRKWDDLNNEFKKYCHRVNKNSKLTVSKNSFGY